MAARPGRVVSPGGRRRGRCRCRWRGSMRGWRRRGTGTGRRSAGCGRRGGAGRMSSRRWRCRKRWPGMRARSGCIRRCWTRRCTPPGCAAAPRVRLRQDTDGTLSLVAADAVGAPVVSVESLVLRPVSAGQLAGDTRGGPADALFSLEWVPVPVPQQHDLVADRWAAIGPDVLGLAAAGVQVHVHPDLAALAEAVAAGGPVPEIVLAGAVAGTGGVPAAARAAAGQALGLVQQWLADERLAAARLVVV